MSKPEFSQVAYMPYSPIKEGFRIGNYEVWPFFKESGKRINNRVIIDHLSRLFGRYFERKSDRAKGIYDKPLDAVFMISPINFEIGVNEFTEEQLEEIKTVCHIITFCAINECAFVSSSADAFILHVYKFQPGGDGVVLGNTFFANLDMVKLVKPYYIDPSLLKFEKTTLSDALGKAVPFKDRKRVRRVFRTLELFYHTATHSEMMTDEHRLLSLIMCFEVLLNFDGKLKFAKMIEKSIDNYKPVSETRKVKIRNKDTELKHSKTTWWAFDLYDLRSHIIHGSNVNWEIEKYGDIWTRIKFGGILIRKLIKKILSQESLWPPDDASDSDIIGDAIIEVDRLDIKLEKMVAEFNETYMGKQK